MDNHGYVDDFSKAVKESKYSMQLYNRDNKPVEKPRTRANSIKPKETEPVEEEKNWYSYTQAEKSRFIIFSIMKFALFIILLYLFLLSLNFMTIGFTLVAGYTISAGPTIKFLLSNPFAALAIGIIATAVMQNATATTSITVSMVGAKIIPDVKSAIPIIMGANIGTCVTNALIALTLAGNPDEFKRSFSGATLNDGFNFLTTAVLITIEIITGVLFHLSEALTKLMPLDHPEKMASANFMAAILNPVIDLFIKLDNEAVDRVSNGGNDTKVALRCCLSKVISLNNTANNSLNNTANNSFNNTAINSLNITANSSLISFDNYTTTESANETICLQECDYWCMPMLKSIGDGGLGLFWIILSIIVVIVCLFGIVKVLSYLIVGPIAAGVRVAVNANLPGKFKWLTEVLLFIFAIFVTIIVQSSNIVTATLVPLCGIGIVTLQRVFVMTLGSNIGTTFTGILTAFTLPPSSLQKSMQLAFVYTLFNVFGVILWLPIPKMRFPKKISRQLGKAVLRYKWFLFFYVAMVYFILPLIVFGLALIPYWIGLAIFCLPVLLLIIFVLIIFFFQKNFQKILPVKLRNFDWLPIWLRSLAPLDKRMKSLGKALTCCKKRKAKYTTNQPQTADAIDDGLDETTMRITEVLRRLSVVEGIVREARVFSRRNSLVDIPSDYDDEDDAQVNYQDENNNKNTNNVKKDTNESNTDSLASSQVVSRF